MQELQCLENPGHPPDHVVSKIEAIDLRLIQNERLDSSQVAENLNSVYGAHHGAHIKKLWECLGHVALAQNKLSVAEICFVRSENYGALLWTRRMHVIGDYRIRMGEIKLFLEEFEEAENCFKQANRPYVFLVEFRKKNAL